MTVYAPTSGVAAHVVTHGFNGSDELIRSTGTWRVYVDGTAGNDASDGTSWVNAWKTWVHAVDQIQALLYNSPPDMTLIIYDRGAFSTEDILLQAQMQGLSQIFIIHALSDHTLSKSGTVTAVTAATEQHGIVRLTLGGGLVLAAGDVGGTLELVGPTESGCSTIIDVDTVNNYAWTTKMTYPAWVVGGGSVVARIYTPSVSGIRDVGLMLSQPTRMRYAPTSSDNYCRATVLGQVCSVLNLTGPGACFGCHVTGAVTYPIRSEMGSNFGVVTNTSMAAAYTAILTEAGFMSGAAGYCSVGNYVPNATSNTLYSVGGYSSFYGYGNKPLRVDQSSFVYAAVSNLPGIESRQGGFCQFEYSISRDQVLVQEGGLGRFQKLTFQVPAAGIANGLFRVKRGIAEILATVEGNNTQAGGSALYGYLFEEGSVVSFAPSSSIRGKHGDLRILSGARARTTSNWTIAARDGAGPDIYVQGSGSALDLGGNVTKSATNVSAGGTAASVLDASDCAAVSQDTGKTFSVATPAVNWNTDYGASGAIYVHECGSARLRTVSGGAGGTAGTGCNVRNASKMVHAGAAGLLGVAAIKIGGLAVGLWPGAALTDAAAGVPELCVVVPNVA